jgi:methylase of polypeptide subunit release factors
LPSPLEGQAAALRTESLSASATPSSIAAVDDRLTADQALRRIEAGELLWYIGDYPNGRQLLSALRRRLVPRSSKSPRAADPVAIFRAERRQRAHEHRILSRLVVAVSREGAVYGKRTPDVASAVRAALGEREGWALVPLQELLGMVGAAEWARKGVEVPGLEGRIHPVYGVFAPTRLEPAKLAARIPDVAGKAVLDVGTGTGVLALLLLARGAASAVATDLDPRAVDCATENARRLGLGERLRVLTVDLFPAEGTFDVVISNPPWLPEPPQTRLDGAIYDRDGRFVSGFLARLEQHLKPGGRGYLILSDFAERLGLREPDYLRREAAASGLQLREIAAERPAHPKAEDKRDPLQVLRAAERTRLFELKV